MRAKLCALWLCVVLADVAQVGETGTSQITDEPHITKHCVAIIVPPTKPYGLMKDAELLSRSFRCSQVVLGDDPSGIESETLLFLENTPNHDPSMHLVYHNLFQDPMQLQTKAIWSMVNIDWLSPVHLLTPNLSLVICKTAVCAEVVQQQRQFHNLSMRIVYTKFTSHDLGHRTVDLNFSSFFHLAGRSSTKNTAAVLLAWLMRPQFPLLTVRAHHNTLLPRVLSHLAQQGVTSLPPNIRIIDEDMSQEDHYSLMAQSGVHICPSGVEGYGHSINEARSLGAVVITTDHPPMNELIDAQSGVLILPSELALWANFSSYRYAHVHVDDVIAAVERVLRLSTQQVERMGNLARQKYDRDTSDFVIASKALDCLRGHQLVGPLEKCGIALL